MPFVIGLIAILALGLVAMLVITRRSSGGQGRLSRETRARDAAASTRTPGTDLEAAETAEARSRSEQAQASAGGGVPVARGTTTVAEWEPLDPEELSVSRRMFFNRAILTVGGLAVLPAFGTAILAFLWPSGVGGFGSKVVAKLSDAQKTWTDKKAPFYVPEARSYLVPYPTDPATQARAKAVFGAQPIWPGIEAGVVALYQKCVHLGCRVPWCDSAQWFECPCHGSKYDRVGEKRDGPAPRGLDRWPVTVDGDNLTIDTSGAVVQGPPIGTDTTKQAAEGPHCV